MTPDLSVIIPVFNRGDLIRHTLASVTAASAGLRVETIIVDDGSTPPVAASLNRLRFAATKLIRQENRGLLFARLAGLSAATGRHVLFLDSDDLVSPEKFHLQLEAIDATESDISYTDTARCVLTDSGPTELTPDAPALLTTDSVAFHITVQPAPHSPIFRRTYLDAVVAHAFFPPSPLYNPVAEIWFYHNAAPRPAGVIKIPGPHTLIGAHPGARLTNHWEKLGVASLAVMEAFARRSPAHSPLALRARQLVAEKAFVSWRRLPRDFSPEFCARQLSIWENLHQAVDLAALGGHYFQKLARVLGPVAAANALRRFQNASYAKSRTLDEASFANLLAALPPP